MSEDTRPEAGHGQDGASQALNRGGQEDGAGTGVRSGMGKSDYGRFEALYLSENIRYADSKAGILIAVNGLLLRMAMDYFKSSGATVTSLLEPVTLVPRAVLALGSVALLGGAVLAISVVFPRRASTPRKGFVFWENIATYASADEYTKDVMATSDDSFDRIMAEQHYFIAKTATSKYRMLRHAFWASSIGASCIVLAAVMME